MNITRPMDHKTILYIELLFDSKDIGYPRYYELINISKRSD